MANLKEKEDRHACEDIAGEDETSGYNRFSDPQAIKNLTILMRWCEKKIEELRSNEQ